MTKFQTPSLPTGFMFYMYAPLHLTFTAVAVSTPPSGDIEQLIRAYQGIPVDHDQ
jgi:hypothetical protein